MADKKRRVTGYGQSFVVRVPDELLEEFLKEARGRGFTGAELVRAWMAAYVVECRAGTWVLD